MLCPSGNFKTQKSSLKCIKSTEDLLAILRTNLNIKHGFRSTFRHILTLRSPNSSVLKLTNPYEAVDDCEEIDAPDIEISRLPIITRLPQPRNHQMPHLNRMIL